MNPEANTEFDTISTTGTGETKKQHWELHKLKASHGFAMMQNQLLDSEAYKAITYCPTVKVLSWFIARIRYEEKKGKNRFKDRKINNNGKISFTYTEAVWRGLSNQQFARALKELYRFGFIDVTYHGSGLMGDYSLYAISDRWKKYGRPGFEMKDFPVSRMTSFRRKAPSEKPNVEN